MNIERIVKSHLVRSFNVDNLDPAVVEYLGRRWPEKTLGEAVWDKYFYTPNFLDLLPKSEKDVMLDFAYWDKENKSPLAEMYNKPTGEGFGLLASNLKVLREYERILEFLNNQIAYLEGVIPTLSGKERQNMEYSLDNTKFERKFIQQALERAVKQFAAP